MDIQKIISDLVAKLTGNTDLIFFISMFGEILMVLFLYLYARAKTKRGKN